MTNFWNPLLEKMPLKDLQRYQIVKFKEQCIYAFNSSTFYRRKFLEAGLQLKNLERISSMDDILKVPISNKSEFVLAQEKKEPFPYGELLAAPIEEITAYHQTSGTMGLPLRWGDTWSDWEWYSDAWAVNMYSRGLTSRDRVYIAFPYHSYIASWGGHYGTEKIGAEVIPGGATTTEQRIEEILDLGCTTIIATPSYALYMSEIAQKKGIDLRKSKVDKIFCTGEPGASVASIKRQLEEAWGAKIFDHIGATEAPVWAFECKEQQGLHINEAHYLLEILNLETMEPASKGEIGTVVVTNLIRKGMPTIRYDLKDLVRLSPGSCPCGRTWRLLEGGVIGRRDELEKIIEASIIGGDLQHPLTKIPTL